MATFPTSPEPPDGQAARPARWRRIAVWTAGALGLAALGAGTFAWLERERIAGNLIDEALAENGLEARYEIVRIGPRLQVIENLVVGDPQAPDLRARRVSIAIGYGLAGPFVEQVSVEGARLFGSFRKGELSFGALDRLLFAQAEEEAGLPRIDVRLVDAGARIETDYGILGASLVGAGNLADGFAGRLALTAPNIAAEDCSAQRLTAYGTLAIEAGAPRFEGPVRVRGLDCAGLRLAAGDLGAALRLDEEFSALEGQFEVEGAGLAAGGAQARRLSGEMRLGWREEQLTLSHDLAGEALTSPFAQIARIGIEGRLRASPDFAQADWSASFTGDDIAAGAALGEALAPLRSGGRETLLEPLLARFERGLARALEGAGAAGEVTWRLRDGQQAIVIPQARIESRAGERVLALSRASWSLREGESGVPRLSGNILVGGSDLPQINGRMEQLASGGLAMRLAMAPFRAGSASLAVPSLQLRQQRSGALRFAGAIEASGAIPGGFVSALEVPLEGVVSPAGALAAGFACETIRFGGLRFYDLALEGRSLRLCPERGRALLRYAGGLDDGGLAIEAVTGPLELTGEIAQTKARLEAQGARLRYPGPFALTQATARLGTAERAIDLSARSLEGTLGEEIGGRFSAGTARIAPVPLDFSGLSGRWRYADGAVRINEARLKLAERTEDEALPRFEPLEARDAILTLSDREVTARALLRNPRTDTAITDVRVSHDLAEGTGEALLAVDRLTFGDNLRLTDLSPLALGVIAYTEGAVSGEGRIAWTPEDVTSTGRFASEGLDLAAAFGPVRGLKGTIEFSDLIGLTTAPGQAIEIGAINPGIEVLAGRVVFALREGTIIDVESARWPFMGGQLVMRPVSLRYGTDEDKRYTFEIIGLDAARFVARMELANIGATGTFDGTVPIAFDAAGNGRIERGLLISRLPGGNVSYVGELLYEDMGAVTNYAFESLRSLDYRQMSVELDGDLAGEIITRFRIDGVRQGEGAARDFLTRRLGKLPIRFNITVRSENFYELATMVRTFVDASALPDPVDQGLLNASEGRYVRPPPPGVPVPPPLRAFPADDAALRRDEPAVQPPESEDKP